MPAPELARAKRAARRRVSAMEEYRAAVIAAHESGCSLRQIATAVGTSHVAVLKIVQRG